MHERWKGNRVLHLHPHMSSASEPAHLSACKLGLPSSLLPQAFALLPLLVVLQLNIGLEITSAI